MNQRFLENIYHANVNVNLMEESVNQIKCGIMINVGASEKTSYMSKRLYLESYM